MTTHTRPLFALAITAALIAAPLAAANAKSGPECRPVAGHYHHKASWHAGKHAARGHMLRRLDLSQDQKDQVFKIRHDQAQAVYDQRKALHAARQAMRKVARADSFDESKAEQAAQNMGKAQAQLSLLHAQAAAKIRAVLTPEQRQKLAQSWTHHRRTADNT
jgi:Spy/CpxP family protein refolding chaperone